MDTNQTQLNATTTKTWSTNLHGTQFFLKELIAKPKLPAGTYDCEMAPFVGPYLAKKNTPKDTILELPDANIEKLVKEFENFWSKKDLYTANGFTHKRGFLLYGPPGTGKTTLIKRLAQVINDKFDGIVLTGYDLDDLSQCIKLIRDIEPSRPIVVMFEDIDTLLDNNFDESELLDILDGHRSPESVMFIATTNYPEKLDKRLTDRPSRFDTLMEIGMPSAAAREMYIRTKFPQIQGEELTKWVDGTENFPLAHLKEIVIATQCFEQPFEEVVARLRKLQENDQND